jgi:hypothetical protein
MIFSSLPDYRRFSDAALQRLREERSTADRFAGVLFNLTILAGLWGAPLYARWMILSESILGTWRTLDGSQFRITFTEDGRFILGWKGIPVETADYRFDNQGKSRVVLSHFRAQFSDVKHSLGQECWFDISLTENALYLRRSLDFRDNPRPGRVWEVGGEHLELPPKQGQSLVLERVR